MHHHFSLQMPTLPISMDQFSLSTVIDIRQANEQKGLLICLPKHRIDAKSMTEYLYGYGSAIMRLQVRVESFGTFSDVFLCIMKGYLRRRWENRRALIAGITWSRTETGGGWWLCYLLDEPEKCLFLTLQASVRLCRMLWGNAKGNRRQCWALSCV